MSMRRLKIVNDANILLSYLNLTTTEFLDCFEHHLASKHGSDKSAVIRHKINTILREMKEKNLI